MNGCSNVGVVKPGSLVWHPPLRGKEEERNAYDWLTGAECRPIKAQYNNVT